MRLIPNLSPKYSKPITTIKLHCTLFNFLQKSKNKTRKGFNLESSHRHFNKHQKPITSLFSHTYKQEKCK
jgi:hypothetical protein